MQIKTHLLGPVDRIPGLPQGLTFPLTQLGQLQVMEERLKEESFRDTVTAALALEGGENPPKFLRAVLKKVLAPSLARLFNNHGQKKKLPFKELTLKVVMFAAVRRAFPRATEKELDTALAAWLTSSRDRQKQAGEDMASDDPAV